EQSDDEWRKKHARVSSVLSDDGLRINFQPIVALDDGRYVGCEALARFPEAPGRTTEEWFDDAAAVGLQTELELAAIEAALARLPALPSDTFMTVNVSPGALLSPRMLDALLASALERVVVEI